MERNNHSTRMAKDTDDYCALYVGGKKKYAA
eukprot:CAMPEP_0197239178 /NCGR_PEP_ID=MMETSP1429-20130617/5694_1 /TAXON_ID=49237 /ORGANISM="Chaetoceros  sp., Strain UNC1202" /LENGTH=30 /DNA_ID= /DNA_START= /DNA_END= /DNA_ORIENTATION=